MMVASSELIFLGGIGEYRKGIKISGKNLSREFHGGNRVYSAEGIAQTLTAQPLGGLGGYTGLYLVEDNDNGKTNMFHNSQ